jgi:acyl-CoA synthetase (AMP-forming)/AMP-acid ligase II
MVSTKHPHTPQRVLDVQGEEVSRVSCGPPPREVDVLIVDPQTLAPVANGEPGEIWVAGPSVGRGYWPGKDAGVFNQSPAGSDDHRWMRTGDLGRLHGGDPAPAPGAIPGRLDVGVIRRRHPGDLFITGRLKSMVIVAGQNHHAEDIEQVALRALGPERSLCAAAFAIDGAEGERLVLAIECRVDDAEREQLAGLVASALAEALDLGASTIEFVPPGRLPRTTSGKVRRHECRELYVAGAPPFSGATQ